MLQRRRFALWGASGLLAPALGALPKAQAADAYPNQPIKIIVSSAAGGLVDGILVAPMRQGGLELFVGTVRDPQWGPGLAVGLGGIWVEALRDTSLRLLPVTPAEVKDMLAELRGARLLDGWRGAPAADRDAIAEAVAAIGNAALALGPELVSLEVNPLRVDGRTVEALDALAVWGAAG